MFYGTPPIVTNGLVLNLDCGNRLSYPTSGTTWTDLSGNNNNGTLTNGPTFNPNNLGSIVFDGVDDFVSITQTPSINLGNDNFSVSFWYKANTWVDSTPLIYKGGNLISNPGWMFRQVSTGLQFILRTSSLTNAATYTNTATEVWVNIVGVFTIGVHTEIYANGISFAQIPNSLTSVSNTLNLDIGKGLDSSASPTTKYYNGKISLTQIYNRALTSQEVIQNYNAYKTRFGLT